MRLFPGIALVTLLASALPAQSIYGTLTGIVSDPSSAVVAAAKITLRNQASGDTRETVTNSDGFYTFVSVPPAAYELTVAAPGFEGFKQTGIAIRGGDKLNVNIEMKLGSTTNVVEVTGSIDVAVPVDSGENSSRLTVKELENFVQLSANAAEFIKIMPGFGIQNGTSNYANYNGQTIGINGNGNGGNQSPLNNAYSYNGLPTNTLDITADGAHVSDPGCNCATPVNPNSNMISEFKITMSNFSAENQKGPGVISSVARGGGQNYHGSGYITARNAVLNANDWLSNATRVPRPENAYYYPGFNLEGPVRLPFTSFNKRHDKLFFFTGLQYFAQVLDTGLIRATVPTAGQRQGNFSPDELLKEGPLTASGSAPQPLKAATLATYPGGIFPKSVIDPNMQAMMNLYPLPNAVGTALSPYNWQDDLHFNQNGYQWMSRVDYSVSENTKVYVRYNLQREVQLFPIGLWSSATTQQPPYPTPIQGRNRSDSVTASLTHVFNDSMTNEFVAAYTFIGFPNVFQDPAKVDRTKVGFAYKGLYKNGVIQIPNLASSGEVASISSSQGGFEVGGARGLYADKYMPSFSDNLTKIWGTHSLKAGVFYEHIRNSQPASNATNGSLGVSNGNPNSTGNPYADQLLGILNSYSETSFNRINDISYDTYEGFVQDSWKVTKNLTLEMGVRITKFTPWADNLGFGFSVFDYSKYNTNCKATDYCGFLWHTRDPSVPLGGFPTPAPFVQPRFGMAYALGHNTVLRGGWGRYYYHSGQFTTGLNVSAGMQTVTLSNNQGPNGTALMANQLDSLNFSSAALSIGGVDRHNDKDPVTDSYSFTVSRRIPGSALVEVAYVGNQSRNILNQTSGGFGADINLVPVGAMLSSKNNGVDPGTLTADKFRPLQGFSALPLATNNLYANYNSLQTKFLRSKGRTVINANYTFAKAMGILSPALDPFNLNNDYGVQSTNRPHIFNVAYSYTLGRVIRNRLGGGLVNGWQVSGVVQWQSGANLTGIRGQNFGMSLNAYKIPGTNYNISSTSLLGTPNIALMPILTCDPTKNLVEHQYLNQNCYSFPTQIGQNGPSIQPVVYGPAYFNTDLSLRKNFLIREGKSLRLSLDGYNPFNHPLWSFNGNANLTLGFNGTTGALSTPTFGYVTGKQGHRILAAGATFKF
jgi:hypothetical protein